MNILLRDFSHFLSTLQLIQTKLNSCNMKNEPCELTNTFIRNSIPDMSILFYSKSSSTPKFSRKAYSISEWTSIAISSNFILTTYKTIILNDKNFYQETLLVSHNNLFVIFLYKYTVKHLADVVKCANLMLHMKHVLACI